MFSSNNLGDRFILHQDNCPLHLGPEARIFFSTNNVNVLKTPPASPDLNPIENIWNLIDRKLSSFLLNNFISTSEQLFDKVSEFAGEIPVETINKLIDTMPRRITDCIENNGKTTKY